MGVDFTIDKIIHEDIFNSGEDDWFVTIFGGFIVGEPKAMIPEETMEVKWFSLSELKDVDLASYTRADFVKFGWIS